MTVIKARYGFYNSPEEPVFNVHPMAMAAELLAEWLKVLAEENNESMKNATPKSGYFQTGVIVKLVFQACEKLHLPTSARYLAFELFEKFMTQHIRDLYKHVQGMTVTNTKRSEEWAIILDRIQNQIPLRILSCCQVSSKLTSNYMIVSPEKVRRLLSSLGHNYKREGILNSELRVLQTLNYRVMLPTPLQHVETLLEIMRHNDNNDDVKVYHGVAIKLLDLLYLRAKDIYDRLYHGATGKHPTTEKEKKTFAAVKNDKMLQAVAVITAASYIVDQSQANKVTDSLSRITQIPGDDILDFAAIIIELVIDGINNETSDISS